MITRDIGDAPRYRRSAAGSVTARAAGGGGAGVPPPARRGRRRDRRQKPPAPSALPLPPFFVARLPTSVFSLRFSSPAHVQTLALISERGVQPVSHFSPVSHVTSSLRQRGGVTASVTARRALTCAKAASSPHQSLSPSLPLPLPLPCIRQRRFCGQKYGMAAKAGGQSAPNRHLRCPKSTSTAPQRGSSLAHADAPQLHGSPP